MTLLGHYRSQQSPRGVMATRQTPPQQTDQLDGERKRLEPAKKFLAEHWKDGNFIGAAAAVSMSPFYFHRTFTRVFAETPKQFTSRLQLNEAKRLLLLDKPMGEVIQECGFAHHSHLCSRFRQLTGETPVRWLRRMKTPLADDQRAIDNKTVDGILADIAKLDAKKATAA